MTKIGKYDKFQCFLVFKDILDKNYDKLSICQMNIQINMQVSLFIYCSNTNTSSLPNKSSK